MSPKWHLGSKAKKKAEFMVPFGAIRALRDGLRRPSRAARAE
jgi:hypothetical protein